jgi:hypothetical protein
VNVRLVIAAVLVTIAGSAIAPAFAAADSPQRQRIDVCVLGPTPQSPNQEGICVGIPSPR